MEPRFHFESEDVPSTTTTQVRDALLSGRGAFVHGRLGAGKTHAVRAAVNGAVWAQVPRQPFAVPRVLSDLAAQVDADESVMAAYSERGCAAACEELETRLGERTVVVDAAEPLWIPADDPVSPDATAVWAQEFGELAGWLLRRITCTPTVVITSRRPSAEITRPIRHDQPRGWPIKLVWSVDGYLPWDEVSQRVGRNPAGLILAAAVLRIAGVRRMRHWLGEDTDDATYGLGSVFRARAPRPMLKVLSVLSAAGELPRELVDRTISTDDELAAGLELALALRLVEERGGVLRPMQLLGKIDAVPRLRRVGGEGLVERLCRGVLDRINDRSSLRPKDARAVLDAHRLQLAVGDFNGALTTARLHLGGLLVHARDLSRDAETEAEYDQARRAYASVLQLLRAGDSPAMQRTTSYAQHYHGYNGHRARTLSLDQVSADYQGSLALWPENALFHARRIALEVERGDLATARRCLVDAYDRVPVHPRRDAVLRVRPAVWAQKKGASLFALELLDHGPALESLVDEDPEAHQMLHAFWRSWSWGVSVDRLETLDGRVVEFRRSVSVRLFSGGTGWDAELEYPPARASGPSPFAAVTRLAEVVANECLRLVCQPTGQLPRHDVGRKGLYLGAVDLALSEIGLPYHRKRWVVGRLEDGDLVPVSGQEQRVSVPDGLASAHSGVGFYFARVPVDRIGQPSGPVEKIVEAGAGQSMLEMLERLRAVAEEDDDVA